MVISESEFEDLLARYLDGEASDKDVERLHQMVGQSDRLREQFREAVRLHVLMRETLVEQAELSSIHESINAKRDHVTPNSSIKQVVVAILATAAVVLALVRWPQQEDSLPVAHGLFLDVSGIADLELDRNGIAHPVKRGDSMSVGDVVRCGADTHAMIRLMDGSIISMEPLSTLTLVSSRPQVRLDRGEVLFEIESRNEGMEPFEVHTGQSTVEVMGTMFTLEADEHTHLTVYEGRVMFKRHIDDAEVEVGSQQMTSTQHQTLNITSLNRPSLESAAVMSLLPTDDVTLDRGEVNDGNHLKVQGNDRTVYLRFEIPPVEGLRHARLRLTQDIDPGSGTLRFYAAESSDWSENDLDPSSVPKRGPLIAQHSGVVRRGQVVDVDVSDAITKAGPLSFVVTLDRDRERDIWFASRESQSPPQLLLTIDRGEEL